MVEFSDSPTSIGVVDYDLSLRPRGDLQLDDADLAVRGVEIVERIGEPYEIDVQVVCGVDLDVDALIGADLVLTLRRDELERTFCGVVLEAHWRTVDADEVRLRLFAGPAIAMLGRGRRSRVYQGLSVVQIVQQIVDESLGERQRTVDVSRLARDHLPRDYCVQFRETTLGFVRRILAEEGITFLFTHDESVETMVLTDGVEAFRGIDAATLDGSGSAGPPIVPVIVDRADLASEASVHAFGWSRRMRPGDVHVAAWDWKATHPTRWDAEVAHGERALEVDVHVLDGDERLTEGGDGQSPHDDRTQVRVADEHAALERWSGRARGRGNVMRFSAGHTFELEGHPHAEYDQPWVLDEVRHTGDIAAAARGEANFGAQYENTFVAVPMTLPYAPRRSDKPRIYGHQIATVVGPAGEEIHTDRFGRIKVWFHWDREGQAASPDTSCWIRVAQTWAGAGWGSMFIPRVGMQVVVSFVDGDPDRPLCVGCVYDGAHDPPWELPAERTKSGIKTQSSPGGGGANELRFEDAKGSEQVYLHAQRNLDEVVRAAHSTSVGASQTLSVGSTQSIKVGDSRDIVVGGNQTIRVEGQPKQPGDLVGHKLEVQGNIETSASLTYTLDAKVGINLICGSTKIVMDPSGIWLTAGQQAMIKLDASVLVAAASMAAQLALGPSGTATLAAATGAAVDIGQDIQAKTPGGATLKIDDAVRLAAFGGAKLDLSTDVALGGATVTAQGSAAKITLNGDAQISGTNAKLFGASGKVIAGAGGVDLQGPKVGIAGYALTSIVAPLVKVN